MPARGARRLPGLAGLSRRPASPTASALGLRCPTSLPVSRERLAAGTQDAKPGGLVTCFRRGGLGCPASGRTGSVG